MRFIVEKSLFLKELLVLGYSDRRGKQQTTVLIWVLFSIVVVILFLEESLVCMISFFSFGIKDFVHILD